ncbi:MAG TPA: hypothetical protein VN657_00940 [Nitrospiraceae bacterium]|nr:hypothetical protein [Nitrospiraceae bacterium]
MPVADLQLAPTTGRRTEHRAGHAVLPGPMGIRPPRGAPTSTTLPKLRLTSVSVLDSSSHRLSPQPAHFRLGQPAQVAHGSSPEPRFHIKVEEIFGWMKMIGPPIRTGSPVRSARIRQVIWSAQRTI